MLKLTRGCTMELDTMEDSDITDMDSVATTAMVLDILFGDVRRGKLSLSPLLSLLLLLMLKLTRGCTMELDTTEDSDITDTDSVATTAMDLDILFGDERRGKRTLSPLLKLKPIPGTTMVLATMVVTMDV